MTFVLVTHSHHQCYGQLLPFTKETLTISIPYTLIYLCFVNDLIMCELPEYLGSRSMYHNCHHIYLLLKLKYIKG